jgi:hypothetical protein
MTLPNNPRTFAETISLDAWRSPFDGEKGEADLHIDVVFSEGRVGGAEEPVRFRLTLRKAEIHVVLDPAEVLRIPPSSVKRASLPVVELTRETENRHSAEVAAGLDVSPEKLNGNLKAKGSASVDVTEKMQEVEKLSRMIVTHRKTENGYAFVIEPNKGQNRLNGQPWNAAQPMLRVKDTKHQRVRGEPPEPKIEIHCRREDLIIEDVQFSDDSGISWKKLSRNKKVAVEQFIKEELSKSGFPCGDISNPFSKIILNDAIPYVDD